jgi:hypothetical protein
MVRKLIVWAVTVLLMFPTWRKPEIAGILAGAAAVALRQ